jgi:decaprenylphospho-beta-D-ribofuranose 2-oxidase
LTRPDQAAPTRQLLTGWGRTAATAAEVWEPATPEEALDGLRSAGPRGVIGRGLGRCYGDAAQNAGGVVLSTARLNRIISIDPDRRRARVEAGVSLDQLMREGLPLGLWPAVTPGTRQVTIGGAIASDVHGKNHHRDGTFCSHVESITLASPGQGVVRASAVENPEVFWASAGGMGLTGVILEATVRLLPVESSVMRVETERIRDLDALMSRMSETDASHRYTVAWIDCLARGGNLGRSILELGDHASRDELAQQTRQSATELVFNPRPRATAPPWVPAGLLNRATASVFNEVWYRKSPRRPHIRFVPLHGFFHPLDAVTGWNRIYGRHGFVQYQFVVPDSRPEVVREAIELLAGHGAGSFLSVLKRFGPANPGPLSFPQPGWTLAVDIPARAPGLTPAELGQLLDRLDESVADAGGRIYLSKDSRLAPRLLSRMYPRLPEWRLVRDRLDPHHAMRSDLARRLGPLLTPAGDGTTSEQRVVAG